ncbi:hypothetical protein DXC34_14120 [Bacteroides stercoris]|jgi:hypothetical protein|uniref:Uncharacterized protein n=1 Tax=Bacteroides stercoris TaxID=46506 RepID=A0A3E4ULK8_BACSE|nr:hypothetical protein [Bacteroides stercoris]RGM11277.1 hypothetical protein DXC34_14120 [Bacteroides stercoris]
MNHIQLNFNVNNQNINFDVDAVYAQFCQGNNNIQICLNIGCLIEDIDKFVCLLIQKIQDDKFVQYSQAKRNICFGSNFKNQPVVLSIIYDLINE